VGWGKDVHTHIYADTPMPSVFSRAGLLPSLLH